MSLLPDREVNGFFLCFLVEHDLKFLWIQILAISFFFLLSSLDGLFIHAELSVEWNKQSEPIQQRLFRCKNIHLVQYPVTICRTVTYAVGLFCCPLKPLIQFFSHTYINKGFFFRGPHLLKSQVLQEIAIHSLASVFLLSCQSACKIRWNLNIVKTWIQFLGLTAWIS